MKENQKDVKKQGITLLILVLTITIAIVLLTTVTVSFNTITRSTKQREFATEINAVQRLVEQYHFLNGIYPTKNKITIDLNSIIPSARIQFEKEAGYTSGSIELKAIDLYQAGVENITRGVPTAEEPNDIYAVSEGTGIVYYVKGQKIGNTTYYTLNDELKRKLDI